MAQVFIFTRKTQMWLLSAHFHQGDAKQPISASSTMFTFLAGTALMEWRVEQLVLPTARAEGGVIRPSKTNVFFTFRQFELNFRPCLGTK